MKNETVTSLIEEEVPPSHSALGDIINTKTLRFKNEHFPNCTSEEWNDWRWQLSHSYTSFDSLREIIGACDGEVVPKNLPIRVTPYYASLLNTDDCGQPLRKTVIPVADELLKRQGESMDPLGESGHNPVPGIIHRYPDRVLFLVTNFCSTYCRYCTRSRMVSKKGYSFSTDTWDRGIEYIRNNEQVRDVILSGGDPLTMFDGMLEHLLSKLRDIPHVEMIRIGTKVPAVMPQRITEQLVNMIKKYHPIYMSVHFTHPDEITPESRAACNALADAGVVMGSQTVLLKGVNDDSTVLKKLYHELLKVRVRPYYLYQCDPIEGSGHFRTPLSTVPFDRYPSE